MFLLLILFFRRRESYNRGQTRRPNFIHRLPAARSVMNVIWSCEFFSFSVDCESQILIFKRIFQNWFLKKMYFLLKLLNTILCKLNNEVSWIKLSFIFQNQKVTTNLNWGMFSKLFGSCTCHIEMSKAYYQIWSF